MNNLRHLFTHFYSMFTSQNWSLGKKYGGQLQVTQRQSKDTHTRTFTINPISSNTVPTTVFTFFILIFGLFSGGPSVIVGRKHVAQIPLLLIFFSIYSTFTRPKKNAA